MSAVRKSLSITDIRFELLASLTLAFTLGFFAPVYLFVNNIQANSASFSQVWYLFAGVFLVGFTAFSLLSILSFVVFRKHFLAWAFLILTICFFVQGFYLHKDIGRLDGTNIDFTKIQDSYWIDGVVWAAIFLFFSLLRKKIKNSTTFILTLLLIVESGLLLFSIIPNLDRLSKAKSKPVDQSVFFKFSKDANYIVLVLDSFPTQLFSDMIGTHPQAVDALKDFTFYDNATGTFPTTKPSIPYLMSGVPYDNQQPFTDYIGDSSIPTVQNDLSQRGIETRYYSVLPYGFKSGWDEVQTIDSSTPQLDELNKQYLVAASRYLPNVFKQPLITQFYSGTAYYHKNINNFANWIPKIEKADSPPVFQLIHITGTHPPYQLDANLNFHPEGTTRVQQALATLKLVHDFIDQLKQKDLYDNSLIILTADHGHSYISESLPNLNIIVEYARPLFLVKLPSQKQSDLDVSHTPMEIGDIREVLINYIDSNGQTKNLFPDHTDEPRSFLYYEWRHADWNNPFLPPILEFSNDGLAYDPSSWSFVGVIPPNTAEFKPLQIEEGTNILDQLSNADTKINFINFKVDKPGALPYGMGPVSCILAEYSGAYPVALVAEGDDFYPTSVLSTQTIQVYLNDQLIVKAPYSRKIVVPLLQPPSRTTSAMNICFGFPDAVSPAQVNNSKDKRLIGYKFTSLRLLAMNEDGSLQNEPTQAAPEVLQSESGFVTLPAHLKFNSTTYETVKGTLGLGWSNPEKTFIWSNGSHSILYFSFPPPAKDIQVQLEIMPFISKGKLMRQRVTIFANGVDLGMHEIKKTEIISLEVPQDLVADGVLTLELELPDNASPESLGMSVDARNLAVALISADIQEIK